MEKLTIPKLKQECRDRGIVCQSKWRKADYVRAIENTYVRKYEPQKAYAGSSPTCEICLARQAFGKGDKGVLKCFECSRKMGGSFTEFSTAKHEAIENYNALFWGNNDELEFVSDLGVVVRIKPDDWFSVDAKLANVLDVHLHDVVIDYEYEFDEDFSLDYRDYKLRGSREPLDFDMTLGEILEKKFGPRNYPDVPTLFSLAQNVAGRKYTKQELYRALPRSMVLDM